MLLITLMTLSVSSMAQVPESDEQHLVDTGDGYWASYEDWEALAEEREEFKKEINDLQIQVVDLKAELQSANAKITMYKESLAAERKQTDVIVSAQKKTIAELESELQLTYDKIALLEENDKLKDEQIDNLKLLYKNKPPGIRDKLRWGFRGAIVATVVWSLQASQ